MKPPEDKANNIPTDEAIEAFARRILPAIRAYYESEEGQRAFAEWKKRKEEGVKR